MLALIVAQVSHHSWFPTVMACTPMSFWKGGASLPLYTTSHTATHNRTNLPQRHGGGVDDLLLMRIVYHIGGRVTWHGQQNAGRMCGQ